MFLRSERTSAPFNKSTGRRLLFQVCIVSLASELVVEELYLGALAAQ